MLSNRVKRNICVVFAVIGVLWVTAKISDIALGGSADYLILASRIMITIVFAVLAVRFNRLVKQGILFGHKQFNLRSEKGNNDLK